jgi:hypothetical protein
MRARMMSGHIPSSDASRRFNAGEPDHDLVHQAAGLIIKPTARPLTFGGVSILANWPWRRECRLVRRRGDRLGLARK